MTPIQKWYSKRMRLIWQHNKNPQLNGLKMRQSRLKKRRKKGRKERKYCVRQIFWSPFLTTRSLRFVSKLLKGFVGSRNLLQILLNSLFRARNLMRAQLLVSYSNITLYVSMKFKTLFPIRLLSLIFIDKATIFKQEYTTKSITLSGMKPLPLKIYSKIFNK